MPRRLRRLRAEFPFILFALILAASLPRQSSAAAAEQPRPLQLEVHINDAPANLIASFVQLADRRIAARRGELIEVGLKTPGSGSADELIVIGDLPGVTYRYDEPAQKIFFKLGDEQRVTRTYDARGNSGAPVVARADYGAVLNYTLFGATTKQVDRFAFAFSGANASLDARLFGPYGTLSQSAIVGSTIVREAEALRLDTTWAYSDPQILRTYRAGDAISGGLAWTRSIRFGGFQVQRNFALRPDLVTLPLPVFSGSAAVPSTLDVYLNNMKAYTQDIPAGPYQINNLPVLSGAGTARIVLRDVAGREIETNLPFYASPTLLQPGLVDFSVEAGFPRASYGISSNSYVDNLVGSASVRVGTYDWLTVEAHTELGAGLLNGGLGAVARVGTWGVFSLAGSASRFDDAFGGLGFQSYVAFDTQIWGINIHASSQRTLGAYNDLASVTARYFPPVPFDVQRSSIGLSPSAFLTSPLPPKSLDAVSIGFPLPFDKGSVGVGYVHRVLHDGKPSDLINVSYSRPVFADASVYVALFADLRDKKTSGVFFGFSMPLGGSVTASTAVASTRNGANVTFDAAKPLQPEPGSYGWRVRDSEGQISSRLAGGSYRSSVAQFEGTVQQVGQDARALMQVEGAIAVMGGGTFLSNRIDDAFAVVDAGAPGINVLYENRPAGTTNARGQLLIPSLKSYQNNKIAIDARDLPVNADAPVTQSIAAPADRSGVFVGFGIKTEVSAAVVILSDKTGKLIAPGTQGQVETSNEAFVVGYDGRAYIKGLGAANTVVVADAAGECRTSFPFAPVKDSQPVIGPLICK